MAPDSAGPGERLVWSLRRRTSDVRCVAVLDHSPREIRILQDEELVLTEQFPTSEAALAWAEAYGAQLKSHGWNASRNPGSHRGAPDVH